MQRRTFLVSSFAAAAAGCAPGVGPVLKVGSQKGGTKALILAAGVLKDAHFKVEWSEFPAAQPLLEAVGAGAVDLGAVGDAPFLFAFASGGKVKAVHATRALGGGAGTVLLVGKDSSARSVTDLRGARIATGRGSIGHYLLLRLLERAGLAPSDVKLVFLSPGDAKAAFSTGAVDAWVTWGPYVAVAERRDGARRLADGQGLMSGYGFEVAGLQAIVDKRPLIADFLARLSTAQRWLATHKAEYAAALAKETGLDLDIAAATVSSTRGEPVPIDAAVLAEEQAVLDRFVAAGAIAGRPDLAQAFDTSFSAAVRA